MGCPACEGRRFGFPADLSQAQRSMCVPHVSQAGAVIGERLRHAESSNPDGWQALVGATIRRERPHLPNGLATSLAGSPTRPCTSCRSLLISPSGHGWPLKAASWFEGRAGDLGVALGEDPEYAPGIPDWLLNLILELGPGGPRSAEAKLVAEALGRVAPELQAVIDADLAIALAQAGHGGSTRGRRSRRTWRPGRTISGSGSTRATRWKPSAILTEPERISRLRAPWRAAQPTSPNARAGLPSGCSSSAARNASQAASRRCSASSELARPAGASVNAAGSERTVGAKRPPSKPSVSALPG